MSNSDPAPDFAALVITPDHRMDAANALAMFCDERIARAEVDMEETRNPDSLAGLQATIDLLKSVQRMANRDFHKWAGEARRAARSAGQEGDNER